MNPLFARTQAVRRSRASRFERLVALAAAAGAMLVLFVVLQADLAPRRFVDAQRQLQDRLVALGAEPANDVLTYLLRANELRLIRETLLLARGDRLVGLEFDRGLGGRRQVPRTSMTPISAGRHTASAWLLILPLSASWLASMGDLAALSSGRRRWLRHVLCGMRVSPVAPLQEPEVRSYSGGGTLLLGACRFFPELHRLRI